MPDLPRAILFDLDDTILAFGSREGLLIEVAEELALPDPPEVGAAVEAAFERFWSDEARSEPWRAHLTEGRAIVVAETFAGLGLSKDAAAFAARFNALRDAQRPEPFPGAVLALERLRALGVRLGLVTNGPAGPQREKVDHFDLSRRFDHVQIEGEVGFGKPHERAYRHAMEALGFGPEETWMVGDNLEWEVAAPQRLGIYAVRHDHTGKGLPPDSNVVPDRIVRLIAELLG